MTGPDDPTTSLTFVGAGPGDPDLLTRAGRDALAAADVVVTDRASLDELVAVHAPGVERVLVGRTSMGPAWPLDAIVELLVGHVVAGRRVVRLKSGDLFVAARTAEETRALARRGIEWSVVPGVSAAVAAPAAAGIPVTRRDLTAAFTVVAGNDDPCYPGIGWEALARAGGTIVVLMGRAHQRVIGEHLLGAGLAPDTPVAVVHAGTRPGQRTVRGRLADLAELRLPAPATVVIGAVAALDLTAPGAAPVPAPAPVPVPVPVPGPGSIPVRAASALDGGGGRARP